MSSPKYKKKGWVFLGLLLLVILIGGGGISIYLIRYSGTNERVCAQCHPEIRELWQNSNGHPADQTSCFQCHSPGRRIIPRGWNLIKHTRDQLVPSEYLADDELISERCLDCHKDVLDLGYTVIKKVIKFNHRIHYQEGLDCVECHRTSGHEYMKGGTNRPSIWECLECHRREFEGPPKNKKCLNCHDVMLAPGRIWH